MNDTPTPETDEHEFPCMTWPSRAHPMVVRSDLARKLERELAAATKQRDMAREHREKLLEILQNVINQRATITAQRDKLAEFLQKVVIVWNHAEWLDENDFESFRTTLQSLIPNEL